jgi:hypothetical protein
VAGNVRAAQPPWLAHRAARELPAGGEFLLAEKILARI